MSGLFSIGLNRGGLTSVLAKTRLTHFERDDLYEGRVNPIFFLFKVLLSLDRKHYNLNHLC